MAGEKEAAVAHLGSEVARLQSALEALETERKLLVESKEKVESEASETCSTMNDLKEELAMSLSLLKEAEDKAVEAAAAYQSLAIVKEEWEVEKGGLESDLRRLEKEKSSLETEMDALRVELEQMQARSDQLSNLVSDSPWDNCEMLRD
jgi:chromosome segregation ATPase